MSINERNLEARKERNAGKVLKKKATFELPTEKLATQTVNWLLSEGIIATAIEDEDEDKFEVTAELLTEAEIVACQKHIGFLMGTNKAAGYVDSAVRNTGKVVDIVGNKVAVPVIKTGLKGMFGFAKTAVTMTARTGGAIISGTKETWSEAKAELATDPELAKAFAPKYDSSKVKVED